MPLIITASIFLLLFCLTLFRVKLFVTYDCGFIFKIKYTFMHPYMVCFKANSYTYIYFGKNKQTKIPAKDGIKMNEHPIQDLMDTALRNIRQMVDVNTIIG